MIGDKLVITDYHRLAAKRIAAAVRDLLGKGTIAVTVAGESGCGKTETAHCLADTLTSDGHRCLVLSQDDYFRLPPKSNHARRLDDIGWVGPGEVRLDLLDEHIAALKASTGERIVKPLVSYDEDRIGEESLESGPLDVVIAEGTYTTLLKKADFHAFIDRTYHQTKKARAIRAREPFDPFIEKVLEIEHKVISSNKAKAHVVIDPPSEEGEE